MRSRLSSRALRASLCTSLALAATGCSTGFEQPFQTSSISARPETGMSHEPYRPAPPSTYSGASLTPSTYEAPAGVATYDNTRWRNQQPSYTAAPAYQPPYQPQYSQQQAYQPQQQPYQPPYQPQGAYPPQSYQPQPYQPRWQPGPQAQAHAAPITTGSLGASKTSQTVVVHQGDTLYSLSRRHGVPVADLVTANSIQDGKIRIGQTLVIPAKTR